MRGFFRQRILVPTGQHQFQALDHFRRYAILAKRLDCLYAQCRHLRHVEQLAVSSVLELKAHLPDRIRSIRSRADVAPDSGNLS